MTSKGKATRGEGETEHQVSPVFGVLPCWIAESLGKAFSFPQLLTSFWSSSSSGICRRNCQGWEDTMHHYQQILQEVDLGVGAL